MKNLNIEDANQSGRLDCAQAASDSRRWRIVVINLICAVIVLFDGTGALLGLKGPISLLWNVHRVMAILGAPLAMLGFVVLVTFGVRHLRAERPPAGALPLSRQ